MKSLREQMEIVNAYAELGSYRAVAALYGTTHRTVKQIVARRERQVCEGEEERARRERKTDAVQDLNTSSIRAS